MPAANATAVQGRNLRRQGEATMASLLDAGVGAMAEKGYAAARVDDVVRLAGVSHGTFYLYFDNKEELFRAVAERCATDTQALTETLGEIGPDAAGRAAVAEWLARFLDLYRRYGVVLRAWVENQVTDLHLARLGARSFERLTATLEQKIGAASDLPPREVELRAVALVAMIERFAYLVTSRDFGFDDEALVDTLAKVVHRGWFSGS